jgi:predicted PurR-regulated permease PerM
MLRLKKLFELPEVAVTITNETYFRLAGLTVFTIVLLYATRKAAHALLLIFIAFFLTIALNGPVYWLSRHLPGKRKGSRTLATTLSFLLIVLLFAGFIASIAPPLVRQTNSFIKAAPHLVQDFRDQDSSTGRIIRKYHLEKQVDSFSKQLSQRLKNVGGSAFSAAQRIGSSAFALLTILVLTFMMLIEGPRWLAFLKDVIPDKHHKNADRMMHEMYKVVSGFANGQVTLAAIAALLIMPAVLAFHVSYPIALFVIIFICGLIPMVGHTIGAIIVTTVALFHSTTAAIVILAWYITYQQIENYLIQPKIQSNSTNMSPLLVFMSVVVGVSFGGLIGGLFAIPVAGCLRIAVLEYLRSENIIDTADVNKELTSETK